MSSGFGYWDREDLLTIMHGLSITAEAANDACWRAGYQAGLISMAIAIGVDPARIRGERPVTVRVIRSEPQKIEVRK